MRLECEKYGIRTDCAIRGTLASKLGAGALGLRGHRFTVECDLVDHA